MTQFLAERWKFIITVLGGVAMVAVDVAPVLAQVEDFSTQNVVRLVIAIATAVGVYAKGNRPVDLGGDVYIEDEFGDLIDGGEVF